MSLQVWLPFTDGTLKQQGLGDVIVTSSNYTVNNNGKLGKCIKTKNATGLDLGYNGNQINTGSISFGGWFKFNHNEIGEVINNARTYTSTYNTPTGQLIGNNSYGGIGIVWNSNNMYTSSPFSSLLICSNIRTSTVNKTTNSYTVIFNTWVHIFVTFNKDTGALTLYINGSKFSETIFSNFSDARSYNLMLNYAGVYVSNGPGLYIPFDCNDIRVYNHCLSSMEVKKLSQGLVLHYPLNRGGLGLSNLLRNGFGELGSENWDNNTNISTSDIPSGQSDIKASFGNGRAIEHIKLYPTHTYKFSTWIKATTTSGNTYPSLFPYDVDGKFINNYNCPDGFNLNTMTTLKQQLKAGDTKIYVNDLSQWNANSGHYYNWAAIFSYTDNNGYTYPDGAYTQNMGRFGSSTTAKVNLDKTNNVITLLSAYTGPTMPVGTKVCASTEGSTYFYPWGGVNLANIQDWTYKESTVYGNHNRLRYAKYVTFWTYTNNRMAGIKIRDLTNEEMDSTTEYDCSGFCNNSVYNSKPTISSDTPKYNISTYFGAYNTPKTDINDTSFLYALTNCSIAWWAKTDVAKTLFFTGQDGSHYVMASNNNNFYHQNAGSPTIYRDGIAGTYKNEAGVWHHYVMTGVNLSSWTQFRINSYSSWPLNGLVSDLRIYATALSAEDVKQLYNSNRL